MIKKWYIIFACFLLFSCSNKHVDKALFIINDLITNPESISYINQKIQVSDLLLVNIKQNPDSYIVLLSKFQNYKVTDIEFIGENNSSLIIEVIDKEGVWNLKFIFKIINDVLILERLVGDDLMPLK